MPTTRRFVEVPMVVAMPLGGFLSDVLVRARGYRWGRAAVPIFGMLASAVVDASGWPRNEHVEA